MPKEQISLTTNDGECPVYVFSPEGSGPWPAAIFYMDGGGIRPVQLEMAERLSAAGYVVVLPDLFYRYGPYGPLVPIELFKGDFMAILGPLMATTGNDKAAEDTSALLAYLENNPKVAGSRYGAVGFCMGGGMAIVSAATYPERFAAVASFHGGNLASDAPTSPHLLVSTLKAELYVAVADNDPFYPEDMAQRFESSLIKAGVSYRADTYPGALHGWMKPDFPVYNQPAAERGWQELLALFERTLPRTV